MIHATIVADSVSPIGIRLTTLSLTYPRFILAELNTHRLLSRNSASSRAIPTKKMLDEIKLAPAMPVRWGKNQKGMQAETDIDKQGQELAQSLWLAARDAAVFHAQQLSELGVHKQITNRVLEPFMHARTVITATEWDNFFTLRRHKDAQPEIKELADAMFHAMQKSTPKLIKQGEWHCPYVAANEPHQLECSVARCARVSYLTHEGRVPDIDSDITLYQRLLSAGHWSPFEHQATPCEADEWYANFRGWKQFRQTLSAMRMQ